MERANTRISWSIARKMSIRLFSQQHSATAPSLSYQLTPIYRAVTIKNKITVGLLTFHAIPWWKIEFFIIYIIPYMYTYQKTNKCNANGRRPESAAPPFRTACSKRPPSRSNFPIASRQHPRHHLHHSQTTAYSLPTAPFSVVGDASLDIPP